MADRTKREAQQRAREQRLTPPEDEDVPALREEFREMQRRIREQHAADAAVTGRLAAQAWRSASSLAEELGAPGFVRDGVVLIGGAGRALALGGADRGVSPPGSPASRQGTLSSRLKARGARPIEVLGGAPRAPHPARSAGRPRPLSAGRLVAGAAPAAPRARGPRPRAEAHAPLRLATELAVSDAAYPPAVRAEEELWGAAVPGGARWACAGVRAAYRTFPAGEPGWGDAWEVDADAMLGAPRGVAALDEALERHAAHMMGLRMGGAPLSGEPGAGAGAWLSAADEFLAQSGVVPPRPPRTNRTRRVPHPVLIGHAASLTPY